MEAPLREIVTNCGEAPMVTPNHAATQAVRLSFGVSMVPASTAR